LGSDPKNAVRRYFDGDALGYWRAYSGSDARGEIFRGRRRLALALCREPLGRVLDVGSGPGVFTEALLERRAECWLVDLSLGMLSTGYARLAANGKACRVRCEVADVEVLPFRSGVFDTVLCVGVLQYLAAPPTALKELARVTRPGGQVIVSFPNRRSPLNVVHRAAVAGLRLTRATLCHLGLEVHPQGSRLTFREDIPNVSFARGELEREGGRVGLRGETATYHSLHFPFSIPGLRSSLRVWDRLTNRVTAQWLLRLCGREVIVRFVREP
jgi:SAM-dependent methyltransferase